MEEESDGPQSVHDAPNTQDMQRIYEEHLAAIYRFVYSKVGNRQDAEDLTSQVFIKAIRSLDNARDAQSIQAWLFQVARTTIADHWREFYRLRADSLDVLLLVGWETSIKDVEKTQEQTEQMVQRLLSHLPPRYRDVLTYRFLLNYSITETAQHMGLTEANIKVLQFRALKRMGAEALRL